MNFRWTLKLPPGYFFAILLGVFAFLFVTGGKIFWPLNAGWLMEGDPATHWLGWQFFRNSPLLQWPLGANPDYGMEIGSSIIFSDSIPLLAFIFKPLSPLLPDTFQYIGLWILICFSLQSFSAWKLLSLFTQDKWLPLIGGVFFAFAPACLWRLHGHYSLFGQWVLIAGLYLYFSKNFSIFRWTGLLIASALIHAYFLVMLVTIWLADLAQRCWLKQIRINQVFSYLFVGGVSIALVMWAAGYFMVGGGMETDGFGRFRMNFLSLIDSNGDWSMLLRDLKGGADDYEGFNYLGLGMLGLGLTAGYEYFRGPKESCHVKTIPILILCVGLFLYAISNHVAVGNCELFSHGLPSIIKPFTNTFRSSGRFFWPVYYLIYLTIFYVIFTRFKSSVAIMLCMVMLFIQLIDSVGIWHVFRNKFVHSPVWATPMQSPVWSSIAHQYRKIIFVLPRNASANWMPLSHFAAKHHMAINTGYFARVDSQKEREARMRLTDSIVNCKLSPDALYVFENDDILWKIASSNISSSDIAGVLDEFRIVAPNLRDCKTCDTRAVVNNPAGKSHNVDYKMERISFSSNGTGQKYQLYGWSWPEKWGTWSDGDAALVLLFLPDAPKDDVELLIDGHAFLADKHQFQEVDVTVNKHPVATLKYDRQFNGGVRLVKIPKLLVSEKNGQLVIKLNFRNPKSPADLGISADTRRLGLGVVSLQLKTAK